MQPTELVSVNPERDERLIYQIVKTDAVCLREEGMEEVYSILVLRADGEVIVESDIVYDVSRRMEACYDLMRKFYAENVLPSRARDEAERML
ncbi:MAG: hypothetical protein IKB34_00110 [Clostridia bacterium]|nr:hypothetical protein [Clostridia bacterium]